MKDVFWDAFMDGFTGAGLFGKLPMPRERGESVECDRYAVYSRNWALISATAMTIGFVYLKRNGHTAASGVLLAYEVLWLTVGLFHARSIE